MTQAQSIDYARTAALHAERKTDWMGLLTLSAFVIALALVAVRMTMLETVRDVFDLTSVGASANTALPPGPGASTTLILDLFCWLPAILVLVRRAIDPQYVLRLHWSHAFMAALALWVCASCLWASDKFAAVVGASTWCAAMALGWAMCQLVRSWMRFRVVCALAVALVMVFIVQAVVYRFVEWPPVKAEWEKIKAAAPLPQSPEDSFARQQMDLKVSSGEPVGFYRSTNTFAAAAALCFFTALGLMLQRWRDKDEPGFPLLIGMLLIALLPVIYLTDSRTAFGGMILCGILFAAAWWERDLLARRWRTIFAIGAGIVVVGIVAVVAIGLTTGGLLHDSLTFRWNYWIGAWRLFLSKPLTGVGWNNFGDAYLAFRVPVAAEEIKDPHNIFFRFLTETGAIGCLLAVCWLGRSAWEICSPVTPRVSTAPLALGQPLLKLIGCIVITFAVLRLIANLPMSMDEIELMKLALFALVMTIGLLVGSVRAAKGFFGDDRPAPLALLGVIIGLAGFLLHGMVDFAFFETGPLLLMMLLLGALLGIRHPGAVGQKPRTGMAIGALGVIGVALLAHGVLLVGPIVHAESKAAEAATYATNRTASAIDLYAAAENASPVDNYDYPQRAGRLLQMSRSFKPEDVIAFYSRAMDANPASAMPVLDLARFLRALQAPEFSKPAIIDNHYRRVLALNPNDVLIRAEFAGYLAETGRPDLAREQAKLALEYNDKLGPNEPRRVRNERLDAIKKLAGEK